MHITPEIQALVGQEATFQSTEAVDAGKIRRFAKALGLEDPRYFDSLKNLPVAPLSFVFSVNHDSLVGVDESGRPTNRLSLPPAFGPAMRGGNRLQFFRPVRVGDQILTRRKITAVSEKEGRGGPLVFLTYDLTYTSQSRDLLGINTETLIFQAAPGGKPIEREEKGAQRNAIPVSPEGQEIPSFRVTVSKIHMMMYAAATWNPYQLHWDSDYSKKKGFRDANVAGPMIGDYLVEMLIRWAGDPSRLVEIEYTNRGMAFPGDTLICRGKIAASEHPSSKQHCEVWVENQEGRLVVKGRAVIDRS